MKKSPRSRLSNKRRIRKTRMRKPVLEALEDRHLLTVSLPELVSLNELGTGAGDSWSDSSSDQTLSADGRYEVFSSSASDLVPNDTNNSSDVFLRDLLTGETTLISQRPDGHSSNRLSDYAVIRADGQYVAFVSASTDLDVTGTNSTSGYYQVYRWDRLADTTVLVSPNGDDTDGGNAYSQFPSISGDGERVAFQTYADDLLTGVTDVNGVWVYDVYVRDFSGSTPTTVLVSRSADDANSTAVYSSQDPRISRDGSRVVYHSNATDLESGVTDINRSGVDLVVFDIASESNHYVSVETTADTTANAGSSRTEQSLSADGRYEVFESTASDLVPDDTNGYADVFLRDLVTGDTTLISHRADGHSANSTSGHAVISADGNYVAFQSSATDLDVTGTSSTSNTQIYRWDRLADTTVLVSPNGDDTDGGNAYSYYPSISGNGERVAFQTYADDLLTGVTDVNGVWVYDVYVRDFSGSTPATVLVSRSADDANSTADYSSQDPRISRDGSRVVYHSNATDLESGVTDINRSGVDLVVFDIASENNHYVSVETTADTTANAGSSRTEQSLSADGRYEVFESTASDLVPNDTNGYTDVFLRDLVTGETTIISQRADGHSANSTSTQAVISADGQYVAFVSASTDLDVTGTNSTSGYYQVYRWDRLADTTVLVSPNGDDTDGGNAYSYYPSISGNGERVAFQTYADDLLTGVTDVNGVWVYDVYVRDFSGSTPATVLVSRSADDATHTSDGSSSDQQISRDGSTVVFTSTASDLAGGVTDGNATARDLFAFVIAAETTSAVNLALGGTATGDSGVGVFVLSDDGQIVAFDSTATDLNAGDTDSYRDILVRDLSGTDVELVSVDTAGLKGNQHSYDPSISGDGRYVAFESYANLDALDTGWWQDIYVRDRGDGIDSPVTTLVSVNSAGTAEGDYYSYDPVISGDGSTIAFSSDASDLDGAITDSNGLRDVFVRDWQAAVPVTHLVSLSSSSADSGNGQSWQPEVSDDGGRIVFTSAATDLVAGVTDVNGTLNDIFAYDGVDVALVTEKGPGRYTSAAAVYDSFDLSDSGQFIAYSTSSVGVVVEEASGYQVYVRDVVAETNELISVDTAGLPGNSNSYDPSISSDGRHVAFESHANLDALDTGWWQDIYVRDRGDGIDSPVTTLVSVNSAGTAEGDYYSYDPVISGDGSTIAFSSDASDLDDAITDSNGDRDVFLRKWRTASPVTDLISRNSGGSTSGDDWSRDARISEDGTTLTFLSDATDLTTLSDTNGQKDLFAVRAAAVTVAAQDAVKLEGDSGLLEYTFVVSRDWYIDNAITVDWAVSGNGIHPADADDFGGTFPTGQVSFAAGETEQIITIEVSGELDVEPDEGFTVTLTDSNENSQVIGETAEGAIQNNDIDLEILADDAVKNEDDSDTTPFTFTVNRIGYTGIVTTVDWAVTGSGADPAKADDFEGSVLPSGTTTFEIGETAQTITVNVSGDVMVELDEEFTVTLSNSSPNAEINVPTLTGTILNDDAALISIGDPSIVEGGTLEFVITIDNPVDVEVTADRETSDGTATEADDDYTSLASSNVSLFVAETTAPLTIQVQTTDDSTVELEETISLILSNLFSDNRDVSFAGLDTTLTGTGTITNDDAALISIDNPNALEGGILEFTITIDNPVDTAVAANRATSDGTATEADDDYTSLASSNVSLFTAGSTAPSTIQVQTTADDTVELDETISLILSSLFSDGRDVSFDGLGGTLTGDGTISNDDAALISISDPSIAEGGILEFTIMIDNPVDATVTADRETSDGTATEADDDYTSLASSNVTLFAAGSTELTTIQVQTNADNTVELDETMNLILSNLFSDNRDVSFAGLETTLTGAGAITNDDAAVITIDDPSVLEGGILEFTISIDNPVDAAVTADRATSDGTATEADDDYTSLASSNVSLFAAGSTTSATIQVQTNADDTVELDETMNLILSNLFSDTRDVSFAGLETTLTGTGTITNDDAALISIDDPSVLEGGILEFTISIDNPVDAAVTADRVTANGTAKLADGDYTRLPAGNVTLFDAGSTGPATIQVQTTEDGTVELDEALYLVLSNLLADDRDVAFASLDDRLVATGAISNDDSALISIDDPNALEGGILEFTITIDYPVDVAVTADRETSDGTATEADDDYTPPASSNISLFAASSTAPVTVQVQTTDDDTVELDETMSLALSNLFSDGRDVSFAGLDVTLAGTGTIANDDVATIIVEGVSANEADGVLNFTVTTDVAIDVEVTVLFRTIAGGTATPGMDYTAVTDQLVTLPAGSTASQTVAVMVTDEKRVELDETILAEIYDLSTTGRDVLIDAGTATGTILNDDEATMADIVGRSDDGRWFVAGSTGDAFDTQVWAERDMSDWTDVVSGDFNGDGLADVAGRSATDGYWWVGQNTGTGFVFKSWTRWTTAVEWEHVMVGDFNGDGKDDIAGRIASSGDWWVARTIEAGTRFTNARWTRWSPNLAWVDIKVGDFNGDGRDDLAGRVATSGEWWVARSIDGVNGFTNSRWGRWSPNVSWVDVSVGDFNGDGQDDLAGRVATSGDWWVAKSNVTGTGFHNSRWARWSPNVSWVDVVVGDFNGDGQDDIAGRVATSGEWWVAKSNQTATGFSNSRWTRWSTNAEWVDVVVGDFDGDGQDDLAGRVATSGDWWVAKSRETGSFQNELWGEWDEGLTWLDVLVDDIVSDE